MAPIKNTNTVAVSESNLDKLDRLAREATSASEAKPDDQALMLVAREARLKAFQARQAAEETVVQRAQRSVKSIGSSVKAATDYLAACQGQGDKHQAGLIASILADIGTIGATVGNVSAELEQLVKSGFVPSKATKVTRSAAIAVTVNAHVALVEQVKAEYLALGYTEEKCGDLFVEKIQGKKILLRVGEKPTEGKVSRYFGFFTAKEITAAAAE